MEKTTQNNFLTQGEQEERDAMITEAVANELSKFTSYDGDSYARLLQCRSDIRAYEFAIKVALKAGESESSSYIDSLIDKLHTSICNEAQLKALAGI